MFTSPSNRRIMERHQTRGLIRWTGSETGRANDGWLCDCSVSGLAFTTSFDDAPSPGDRIRILGGDSQGQMLNVIRVRPLRGDTVMIACTPNCG
jgi:hypothetical protein